jgi:hypothetical protein
VFPPETQYARSGDIFIAYQVLGDAPLDLVFVPGFVSHVEHWWEAPHQPVHAAPRLLFPAHPV